VRALERAGQYVAGTRMDRWLLSILHSIWLNEVRARRVRQGAGQVDADGQLAFDGEYAAQTHVMAAQVIRRVDALPETQRETVYLAYVEGLSYREVPRSCKCRSVRDEPSGHRAPETGRVPAAASRAENHRR
jgi:RNA polymerase sigma-70 factor (ECF subfamily)